MNSSSITPRLGPNFAAADLGTFADLRQYCFTASDIPLKIEGKVFLQQLLQLTSSEISLNHLPPQTSIPFYHKHHLNEEIYIFIEGMGEFQVDGQIFPIQPGTIVRVDPEGERCLRNSSPGENLCWITIQARAGSYSGHTIEDGVGIPKPVQWNSMAER